VTDRVIAGRFLLADPLGHGGMGTVWRAEDQLLARTVALKEVHLPSTIPKVEREALRERVMREARAAAKLSHPAAVTVFDVLEEDDNIFIAMELVESPTLSRIVEEEGPLTPARAARTGLAVLDALEVAHARGIIHRDVKPANIMVGPEDRVKLADFGVASIKGDPRLTATGMVIGSPSFMSPEQVSGLPPEPASDLWGLGATLYFATEGKGPFDRPGPIPTLMAITQEDPSPPSHAGPLEAVISSLLSKDPDKRPRPSELRAVLERVAANGSFPAIAPAPAIDEAPDAPPVQTAVAAETMAAPERLEEIEDSEAAQPGPPVGAAEPAEETEEPPIASPGPLVAAAGPSDAPIEASTSADTLVDSLRPEEAREAEAMTAPAIEPTLHEERAAPPRRAAVHVQSPRPVDVSSRTPVQPVRSRRKWGPIAAVAALVLLALLMVPRLFGPEPERSEQQPPTEQTPPAAGTTEEGRASQAEDPPAEAEAGSLPQGWQRQAIGNTGYSIGRPRDWRLIQNPIGDGSSLRFQGPNGRYLLVDWTDQPGDDAVEAWEQQAAGFASRHANYRQIQISPTEFKGFPTAALWEWTYSSGGADLHAANLGFANETWGFALNFQTRSEDWDESQSTFERFQETFSGGS
jgi:tRNA A-37 threonylcarbamoyl transferase component Bud32